jgi:hypothetical protein
MLIDFMIPRIFRASPLAAVAVASLSILAAACQKVPLLAPSGSTITLTVAATALPVNGTAQVVAQVIEASGTPPHSGTEITFTTSLGTIEPAVSTTDNSGRAVVTFKAGSANGTATITAISGGASVSAANAVKIAIGSAAVGRVNVSASPATIPAIGGSSTIIANVVDINGNPLTSTLVNFSTTAGSLSSTAVNTDQNGVAQTQLTTSLQATITASVGGQGSTGGGAGAGNGAGAGAGAGAGGGAATPTPPANTSGQASGTVTVNVTAAPTLVITPPTTAPSAGLPAIFSFVITAAAQNGSAVRDVTVSWGDGDVQDLGAISGTQPESHVYTASRTYLVSATLTDASGNTTTSSTSVSVIPVPRPSINIQATPGQTGTFTATFTITITVPQGIAVQDVTIKFGDGLSQDVGGAPTGTITGVTHQYPAAGVRNVEVDVLDSAGQVTVATVQVTVS